MKRLFVFILLAASAAAQTTLQGVTLKGISVSRGTAAAPAFSPAAGAISSGSTVSISTATSACSSYIYWNFTGTSMASGTNSATSSAITTSSTLYAQVIGCPGLNDSAISSAPYTVGSTFALVDTPQGVIGSQSTSLSTSTGMNTTGASLLVVEVSFYYSASLGSISVSSTSNASGNWHALTAFGSGGNAGYSQFFYCYGPTTGTSEIFTVSGAADYYGINAAAFSGTSTTSAVYQSGSNTGATSGASAVATIQPGSVTPAQSGSLIVTGFASGQSASTSVSIDSGFTSVAYQHNGSGTDSGFAYLVQSGTAAVNPTWTPSATTDLSASIAVFH